MAQDPQQIINTANSFLLAAERALEQRPLGFGQLQMLMVPAVVSTAFAVELYFKAIIILEKGNAKIHDLSALFNLLSAHSQATLIAGVKLDQFVFEQKLGAISGVFIEWRYIYEQRSANLDFQFLTRLARESEQIAKVMANPPVNTDDAS